MKKLTVLMILVFLAQAVTANSFEEALTGGSEKYWIFNYGYYNEEGYEHRLRSHIFNYIDVFLFRKDYTFMVLHEVSDDYFSLRPDPALRISNYVNIAEGIWKIRDGKFLLFFYPMPIIITEGIGLLEMRHRLRSNDYYDEILETDLKPHLWMPENIMESYKIESFIPVTDPIAKLILGHHLRVYDSPAETSLLTLTMHDFMEHTERNDYQSVEAKFEFIDCTQYMRQLESLLRFEGSEKEYSKVIPGKKESAIETLLSDLESEFENILSERRDYRILDFGDSKNLLIYQE